MGRKVSVCSHLWSEFICTCIGLGSRWWCWLYNSGMGWGKGLHFTGSGGDARVLEGRVIDQESVKLPWSYVSRKKRSSAAVAVPATWVLQKKKKAAQMLKSTACSLITPPSCPASTPPHSHKHRRLVRILPTWFDTPTTLDTSPPLLVCSRFTSADV